MRYAIFVLVLWLSGALQASAATSPTCSNYAGLPFVNLSHAGEFSLTVNVNLDGDPICLSDGVSIPSSFIPLNILHKMGERYVIARRVPSGHLAILLENGEKAFEPLNMSYDERSSLSIQHAFTSEGRMFLLVYDTAVNLPSGRRFSPPSEGNDLYEIIVNDSNASLKKITKTPIQSGLDIAAFDAEISGGHLVCTQTSCGLIVSSGDSLELEAIRLPSKGALIELASDGQSAWGLFQAQFDDRLMKLPSADESIFFVCQIREQSICEDVPAATIPYRLRVQDGKPIYSSVQAVGDLVELFSFDLHRLRGTGVAGYSQNNLEGQITWSTVYYLNGLITLALNQAELPGAFKELTQKAHERAKFEARRIAGLNSKQFPWYYSKRYSLNREPITSIVHLGRIARVLKRSQELGSDATVNRALEVLKNELVKPTLSVERIFDPSGQGRTEARFLRDSPFWADGINVAWNYQSAWVEALAILGVLEEDQNLKNTVSRMLKLFLNDEGFSGKPAKWNYTGGDFLHGWAAEKDVSTNTPAYPGDRTNTTTAHISYRTMDAMALLAARRMGIMDVPEDLRVHFRGLVDKGLLYPFTSEELAIVGEQPRIPFDVARHYARSVLPHQLQNQPWALAALARMLENKLVR